MRRGTILPALLGLALLAGSGAAVAQEPGDATGRDCPDGFACSIFEGQTLEIDTRYGSVCVVTRVETIRTETLGGVEETRQAYCTEFEERGDTYEPEDHEQRLTPEQAAVADPGDFLVMRFAEVQD